MMMHPMADPSVLLPHAFFRQVDTPFPMPPQAEQLSTHFISHESPRNYLYGDLFTISYTALDASDSYSAPSSPTSFSQLAITIPATITAMHSAAVHPSPNVPKDIKASNHIWSCRPCACVFDRFRCVVILAHLCL